MFWENSYLANLIPHLLGDDYLVDHSNLKKMQTRQVFNDCNRPGQYIEWQRQYHGQNKLYTFTETKKKLEVPRTEQVNIDYRKPGQPRWLQLETACSPPPPGTPMTSLKIVIQIIGNHMQSNKSKKKFYSLYQIHWNFSTDKMWSSIYSTSVLLMNFNNNNKNLKSIQKRI